MQRFDVGVLGDLLERVKRATGPDPELDARVLCALAAPAGSWVEQSQINGAWVIYDGKDSRGRPSSWEKKGWFRSDQWPLTASVDTAIALAERILHGHRMTMSVTLGALEPDGFAGVSKAPMDDGGAFYAELAQGMPSAPLAILAALLTALIAQKDSAHG